MLLITPFSAVQWSASASVVHSFYIRSYDCPSGGGKLKLIMNISYKKKVYYIHDFYNNNYFR